MGMTLDAWKGLLNVSPSKRSSKPGGFWAECPCHPDHEPSLHCYIGSDGQTVMKCHVCEADRVAVAEHFGKTLSDVAVDAITGEPPARYARGRKRGKDGGKAQTGGQDKGTQDGREAEKAGSDGQAQNGPRLAMQPFALGQTWRERDGTVLTLTRIYEYRDADGTLKKTKARYEGTGADGQKEKTFAFQSVGEDGKLYSADLWHELLYRLPEMLEAKAHGGTIYVVEGEKDANNLAALGFCAVSSAYGGGRGSLKKKWLPAYTQALSGAARVVVIPDNDEAGENLGRYICEALAGKVGELFVLRLREFLDAKEQEQFAKGDFTDWAHLMQRGRGMKREAIIRYFGELTDCALPYVRQGKEISLAAGTQAQGGQDAAQAGQKNGQDAAQGREEAAGGNSGKGGGSGASGGDGGDGGDRFERYMGLYEYCVEGGRLCRIQGHGKSAWAKPLCDFVPELKETITRDDGMVQDTEWIIAAKDRLGRRLPEAQVKNDEFLGMKWPAKVWKSFGNIYPGGLTAGYVKDAILRGGQGRARDRTVYGYTGWRRDGEKVMFLYNGGAIGADDVSVELIAASPHYHLRLPEAEGYGEEDLERMGAQAIAALAQHFPARIIMPLLAQAFLAPLYSTLVALGRTPGYVVFLVGRTGSFKSTLQGYVQSMFGDFHAKQMPANFRSTSNWTADAPYYCKDMLFTCDDFYQTKTKRESDELARVANSLISAASDRAARNRQNADKGIIKGRPVRSTVTMTGEVLPEINEGRTLRLMVVHVDPGEVAASPEELEPYARLQRGGAYRAGMRGYIKWLMARFDALVGEVDERLADGMRRAAALDIDARYARLRENAGFLLTGVQAMLDWMLAEGAIDDATAQTLASAAAEGIGENLARQTEDIADMTPAQVYMNIVRSLITTQAVATISLNDTDNAPQVDGRRDYANRPVVGWFDASFYYFDPEALDQCVRRNLKDREANLGMSATAVRRQMMEMGLIVPGSDRGLPTPLRARRVGRRIMKLLWVDRARIDGVAQEPDSEPADSGFAPLDEQEKIPF